MLLVKLVGQSAPLELDLNGRALRGLCMFLAGNQNSAKVHVKLALGRLVYLGTGNQSRTDVDIQGGGTIGSIVGSLRGNQSQLNITGAGATTCAAAMVSNRGNSVPFACQ